MVSYRYSDLQHDSTIAMHTTINFDLEITGIEKITSYSQLYILMKQLRPMVMLSCNL